jgi:hypothetical protein
VTLSFALVLACVVAGARLSAAAGGAERSGQDCEVVTAVGVEVDVTALPVDFGLELDVEEDDDAGVGVAVGTVATVCELVVGCVAVSA